MHINIGFGTLKVKCTQYRICSQAIFKNARAMVFLKLGGAGNNFRSGSKKSRVGAKSLQEGCPRPDPTHPIVHKGGLNVCHIKALDTTHGKFENRLRASKATSWLLANELIFTKVVHNNYRGEMGSYMLFQGPFIKVSPIRSSWWTHVNFVSGWLYLSATNPGRMSGWIHDSHVFSWVRVHSSLRMK